jgi:hypothetical protein
MAKKVTKYDSATTIPTGRFVEELLFGLEMGVVIYRSGKAKLTAPPCQSVVPRKSRVHRQMSGDVTNRELDVYPSRAVSAKIFLDQDEAHGTIPRRSEGGLK